MVTTGDFGEWATADAGSIVSKSWEDPMSIRFPKPDASVVYDTYFLHSPEWEAAQNP
jgi:hypothetical protein